MIAMWSDLYLKRLVRELNSTQDGFYAPVETPVETCKIRCNKARLKAGVIQCHSPAASPDWFTPSENSFTDAYGRDICASRHGGGE